MRPLATLAHALNILQVLTKWYLLRQVVSALPSSRNDDKDVVLARLHAQPGLSASMLSQAPEEGDDPTAHIVTGLSSSQTGTPKGSQIELTRMGEPRGMQAAVQPLPLPVALPEANASPQRGMIGVGGPASTAGGLASPQAPGTPKDTATEALRSAIHILSSYLDRYAVTCAGSCITTCCRRACSLRCAMLYTMMAGCCPYNLADVGDDFPTAAECARVRPRFGTCAAQH